MKFFILIFLLLSSSLFADKIFEYQVIDNSLATLINSDDFQEDSTSYCKDKLDPSALCSDKERSNHSNPDSRRFLIDWIEYAYLD